MSFTVDSTENCQISNGLEVRLQKQVRQPEWLQKHLIISPFMQCYDIYMCWDIRHCVLQLLSWNVERSHGYCTKGHYDLKVIPKYFCIHISKYSKPNDGVEVNENTKRVTQRSNSGRGDETVHGL